MSFFEKFFGNIKNAKDTKEHVTQDKNVNEEINVSIGPVITIAREFGSGGREIAEKVAKKLDFKFYDKEQIIKVAKESGIDTDLFEQVDENSMDKFWFTVSKMAYDIPNDENSFETKVSNDKMFMIQSDAIRSLAKNGNAVFVGRCASYILKNRAKKIFIIAEMKDRIKRIEKRYKLNEIEARKLIEVADKKREKYYDYYTNSQWNDMKNYDLVINVSEMGIDGAVEKIVKLVKNDN